MDASELDYPLPAEAIAQVPVEPRDSARLLVDRGAGHDPEHRRVADLAELLEPGDVLVLNDTRVIPARLNLRKASGGAVEVLLLERRPEGWWEALVKPSRRVADGTLLYLADAGAVAAVGGVLGDDGRRRVDLLADGAGDLDLLVAHGEVPLPPYIHERISDPERYQTVYAREPGSVAAPTAGLHLTEDLIARIVAKGVTVVAVELIVGLGTFRPVTTERVEDHPMHAERYRIPPETLGAIAGVRAGGRVVAVGTTVVRALESWATTGVTDGSTELFIHGDHRFEVVDALMTNFHVPRSSLLALVEAFVGPRWRDLYETALAEGYRFLSFGDAMLIERRDRADRGGPPGSGATT